MPITTINNTAVCATFWNNLSRLMKERGISDTFLAEQIGVSPGSLYNARSKQTLLNTMSTIKTALVLNVSLDSLFSLPRPPSPSSAPTTNDDSSVINAFLDLSPENKKTVSKMIAFLAAEEDSDFLKKSSER